MLFRNFNAHRNFIPQKASVEGKIAAMAPLAIQTMVGSELEAHFSPYPSGQQHSTDPSSHRIHSSLPASPDGSTINLQGL